MRTAKNIIPFNAKRTCTGCSVEKSLSDFYYNPKTNRNYQCRQCQKIKEYIRYSDIPVQIKRKILKENGIKVQKIGDATTPKWESDAQTNSHYKTRYKITLDEVKKLLENQMGLCANRACGKEIMIHGKNGKKACVDHDHKTGKVRGMLCSGCNVALGHLREDKSFILGLVEYLHKNGRGL